MEVDERLEGDLCPDVSFRRSCFHLLICVVERIHVGLVVFAVMELHDFARNRWLQGTIVVYNQSVSYQCYPDGRQGLENAYIGGLVA